MLRVKRKIVVYMLVSVTVFTAVFTSYVQSVYAKEALADVAKRTFQYLFSQYGGEVIADDVIEDFYTKCKDQIDAVQYTQNEDGTVTFSEDQVKQLCDLLDQYFEETPEAIDVVWLPVITEKNLKASWFQSTESYYKAMSILTAEDAPDLIGLYRDHHVSQYTSMHMDVFVNVDENGNYSASNTGHYSYTPLYFDLSDMVMHLNATQFYESFINSVAYLTNAFGNEYTTNVYNHVQFIDKNGVSTSHSGWYWNVGSGWKKVDSADQVNSRIIPRTAVFNPFYEGLLGTPANYNRYFVPVASSKSGIHYIPVFANANAYKNWITGQGSYYKFDSGYTGGSITVNPNADYSKITDALADIMKQSMANGENMTTMLSRMQATFSKTLGEISGALGDIEDNTQETNNWLQKIFDLLEAQQKELQDYFASSGESLDDLIGLLSHTDDDGNRTSIYDLLGSFLLLFRVQQEDLQAYMADAQDFFKLFPFELKSWISSARTDITDAIAEVVDAVKSMNMSVNINPDDLDPGGGDGESLWTQLGKGLAKILTAILDLLKVLIFKGLDALGYLAGVMVDNIGTVFDGIEEYFDRYISYIEENTFFAEIRGILPEELGTFMVLGFFSIAIAGIIKYAKKG